ncbi:MAG: NADP-dependent 3-hydroxy acid dehydrogenase YdfG [Francisellaceae bacterium]|jgi:NADP-dependent 3-hydroxy acid dehydrogenase YdfG
MVNLKNERGVKMIDLNNKHVIIFGASSGMGQAIAISCLELGLNVSICARRLDKLKEISKISSDKCYACHLDIQHKEKVNKFVLGATQNFGQPDYVVNCVGVMYYQFMKNASYDEWLTMVNVNIIGFLNITQAVLQPIISTKGALINITSDAGVKPFPGLAVYSGTKAFMEFTLKGLRQELVNSGVRVLNIQPGNVKTSLHCMSADKEAQQKYGSDQTENFLNVIDIANAVIYAMGQPKNVSINDLLIEPQQEPI